MLLLSIEVDTVDVIFDGRRLKRMGLYKLLKNGIVLISWMHGLGPGY